MNDSVPTSPAQPDIVPYETWLAARDALLPREKAHTREGDAIAAARRRLPMTEVDAQTPMVGPDGPVPLIDLFEGRPQLLLYKHMWHAGRPFEEQCEGCTATIWDIHDASYLHARDISFAVAAQGPWDEVAPFVEFMGYRVPWYSAAEASGPLFDDFGEYLCFLRVGDAVYLTNSVTGRGCEVGMVTSQRLPDLMIHGRQEQWEDSPEGWPQKPTFHAWRRDGRPVPQWSRPGPHQG